MHFRARKVIPFILRNYMWVVLITMLIVGVVVCVRLSLGSEPPTPPPLSSTEDVLREYWRERVATLDGDVVYREFKETYVTQDANKWHWGMHILASLLYEHYGVDALDFCDDSFQQACFHELMSSYAYEGRVLDTGGINDLCATSWNCRHGIGHGLIMYYGYDQEALSKVLEVCPKETKGIPIDSCHSGAFMEYVTRTMGLTRNEIDRNIHTVEQDLCAQVAAEYRNPCHFVMVEWIIAHTDQSHSEIVNAVGEYCSALAVEYKEACFRGAGFNVKFHTASAQEGVTLCEKIAQERTGDQDSCIIGLSMQYMFFQKNDIARAICSKVSAAQKDVCAFIPDV